MRSFFPAFFLSKEKNESMAGGYNTKNQKILKTRKPKERAKTKSQFLPILCEWNEKNSIFVIFLSTLNLTSSLTSVLYLYSIFFVGLDCLLIFQCSHLLNDIHFYTFYICIKPKRCTVK